MKSVHNVQKVNSISKVCCYELSVVGYLHSGWISQKCYPQAFSSQLCTSFPGHDQSTSQTEGCFFNVWVFSVWNPKGEKKNGGEGWKKRYQLSNLVSQRVEEFEAIVKFQCQEPHVCIYFKQSLSSCAWQILPVHLPRHEESCWYTHSSSPEHSLLEYFWKSPTKCALTFRIEEKVKDWTSVRGHPEKVLMTQLPLYLLSYFLTQPCLALEGLWGHETYQDAAAELVSKSSTYDRPE